MIKNKCSVHQKKLKTDQEKWIKMQQQKEQQKRKSGKNTTKTGRKNRFQAWKLQACSSYRVEAWHWVGVDGTKAQAQSNKQEQHRHKSLDLVVISVSFIAKVEDAHDAKTNKKQQKQNSELIFSHKRARLLL